MHIDALQGFHWRDLPVIAWSMQSPSMNDIWWPDRQNYVNLIWTWASPAFVVLELVFKYHGKKEKPFCVICSERYKWKFLLISARRYLFEKGRNEKKKYKEKEKEINATLSWFNFVFLIRWLIISCSLRLAFHVNRFFLIFFSDSSSWLPQENMV